MNSDAGLVPKVTAVVVTTGWGSLAFGLSLLVAAFILLYYHRQHYEFWSRILPARFISHTIGFIVAPAILGLFGAIACIISISHLIK